MTKRELLSGMLGIAWGATLVGIAVAAFWRDQNGFVLILPVVLLTVLTFIFICSD